MRVELLADMPGPFGMQNAGDKIDVSDDEALRMVKAGQAALLVTQERATPKRRGERRG
jgi:hypothetical protein